MSNNPSDPRKGYKQTLVLEEVNAKNRDEMYCPECKQQTVVEHPIASEYPTKKTKIIRGSQCANCGNIIEDDKIKAQYNPESITQKATKPKNIGVFIGLIVLMGFVASFGLGYNVPIIDTLFTTPEVTVEGVVTDQSGSVISGATISYGDEYETTTNEQGEYEIQDVEIGEYTVDIDSSDHERGFTGDVEVSEESIEVVDPAVSSQLYQIDGLMAQFQFPSRVSVVDEFDAFNTTRELRYLRDSHAESATISVSPLDPQNLEGTAEDTIGINEQKQLSTGGEITSATGIGRGIVATEFFSESGQSNERGETQITVEGTEEPEEATLSISEEASVSQREEIINLSSNTSQNFAVDGTVTDDSGKITLRGQARGESQEESGEWMSGDSIELTIDEEDAPSTATLDILGNVTEETISETGQLGSSSSDEISFSAEGSLQPNDGQITFSGGDIESSQINSTSISSSGENGTEEQTTEIATVDQDGTYELEYSIDIDQSPSLVEAGYSINGDRTQLTGSGTEDLSLSSGDTVSSWVISEKEELQYVNHQDSSSIEVTSVDLQSTNVEVGESIGWRATVENTGTTQSQTEIVGYADGSEWDSEVVQLRGEESTTVTFDRISFDEPGVYAIQVNNSSITEVNVGDGELDYGIGSIDSTLNYLAETGSVSIDTDSSGTTDCQIEVGSDSVCDLELNNGTNSFSVEQENISNTSYNVSYTSRSGASDIQVDMTGDGTNEIDYTGELPSGESISESVSLSSGTHQMNLTTGNNESIEYRLRWTQSGVISNPQVLLNGSEVISVSDTFRGEREFSIPAEEFRNNASNNIELRTDDSEEHTIVIEWSEQGDDTYPTVISTQNNSTLCTGSDFSGGTQCDLTEQLSPGTTDIQFVDGNSPESNVEYEFNHTARELPRQITLQEVDTETEIATFDPSSAQEREADSTWIHSQSIDVERDTSYEIEVTSIGSFNPEAEVTIQHTSIREQSVRPSIIVERSDGSTEEFNISEQHLDSQGELVESSTIEIPESTFKRGVNRIHFESENRGVYSVELVGTEDG